MATQCPKEGGNNTVPWSRKIEAVCERGVEIMAFFSRSV